MVINSEYYNNLAKDLEQSYGDLEAFYLEKNSGKSNTIQARLEELRQKEQALKLKTEEEAILNLNNPNEGLEKIELLDEGKVEEEVAQLKDLTEDQIDNMTKQELVDEISEFQLRSEARPNSNFRINTSSKGNVPVFKKVLKYYVKFPDLTPEERYTLWTTTLTTDAAKRAEKKAQPPPKKSSKKSSKKEAPIKGKGLNNRGLIPREYFDSDGIDKQNTLMLLASYINGNDNPYLRKELKKLLKKIN